MTKHDPIIQFIGDGVSDEFMAKMRERIGAKVNRCHNYPCRAPRAAGDGLYCQRCREEITAQAWLLIQNEEP